MFILRPPRPGRDLAARKKEGDRDRIGSGGAAAGSVLGNKGPVSPMDLDLAALVDEEELRGWVAEFSGLRHGGENYEALAGKGALLEARLRELGFEAGRDTFTYRGRPYFNLVADLEGRGGAPPFLVGAHYDGSAGTPGRTTTRAGWPPFWGRRRRWRGSMKARPARRSGSRASRWRSPRGPWTGATATAAATSPARPGGAETATRGSTSSRWWGYTDKRPGSQRIPSRVRVDAPDAGTFIGAVGNRRARGLLERFEGAAGRRVPALPVVTYQVALRGWLLPVSRWSDHAPFWDRGYPAVMLTDTSFLRNPHYHGPTDLPETLDYSFLANVTRALAAAVTEG